MKTKAALDYENKSRYSVTVSVRDNKDVNGNADSIADDEITVTINVTNVDEAGTVTLSTAQPQVGAAVTASLSDPDGRITGQTWQWATSTTANSGYANINGATSASYTPVAGDVGKYLRAAASYTDQFGSGKRVQATSANAVQAAPLTNRAPAFSSGATATRSVPENTATNQNIGAPVTATDANLGDILTYSLGGSDGASFAIDTSSGQLKTKAALDYERKSSYSVIVSVRDNKDAKGKADSVADATITVTINVANVNEAPVFSGPTATRNIPENTAANQNIGAAVTATDPDNGDSLTYSLGGTDGASFAIDASSGQLKTRADLDYESKPSYSVIVSVRDSKDANGSPNSAADATITVTINVTNVNEVPVFSGPTESRSVPEDADIGDNVGDPVTATDPDAGDVLTYTLGGTDASSFSVVPSTGQLQTRTDLDYDTGQRSYTVTVTATDRAGLTADVTVNIAVTDVNEPPVLSGRAAVEYIENGTGPVATYTATDPDGSSVTWSLSGDDGGVFSIDASGSLTFRTPPDYEHPADADNDNVYLVTVEGSDGAATDSLSVTVTVTDVNESPAFPAETGSRSVNENTAADRPLGGAVSANDPEGDTLTYTLGGTDGKSFAIDAATGQLKTKAPLDYEAKSTPTR